MDRIVKKEDLVLKLNALKAEIEANLAGMDKEGITGEEVGQLKFKLEKAIMDASETLAGRRKFSSSKEAMAQIEAWYEQAKKTSVEELPAFIRALVDGYDHVDVTFVSSIGAGMIAALNAYLIDKGMGQLAHRNFIHNQIMWELVKRLLPETPNCPLKLFILDELLHKRYCDHMLAIEEWQVQWLQVKAQQVKDELLKHKDEVKPEDQVNYDAEIAHLDTILAGKVPGFNIVPNTENMAKDQIERLVNAARVQVAPSAETEEKCAECEDKITPPENVAAPQDVPSA